MRAPAPPSLAGPEKAPPPGGLGCFLGSRGSCWWWAGLGPSSLSEGRLPSLTGKPVRGRAVVAGLAQAWGPYGREEGRGAGPGLRISSLSPPPAPW